MCVYIYMYICIYMYIYTKVIPKTQKMVLDVSLLNTQHYKVRIKGKVEQSREGVAPSPTPWCSSYRKGSLRVTLDYGRQLYLLYIYIYIYIYIGFFVEDSLTFSSMVHQLLPCVDSQFKLSFDITSLFTNVPLDEAISICAESLYRRLLTCAPSSPESAFVELMKLATKSVSFSFNDTMYRQVDDISLGSPLDPILAKTTL